MKLNFGKDQLSIFHPSLETISDCTLYNARDTLSSNGYYRFDKFITTSTVEMLQDEINKLIKNASSLSTYRLYCNSNGDVVVMNRLDKESDFLYDFIRNQKLIEIASFLLGKYAMPLHAEYFSKPAKSSTPSPPHQDHIFYQDHFEDELAISFWIALDNVSENSGALEYAIPANKILLPHKSSTAVDFDFELKDTKDFAFQKVPVACGGCIVHDSYVVHRSQKNLSNQPRRAVVLNYRGSPYRTWLQSNEIDKNE